MSDIEREQDNTGDPDEVSVRESYAKAVAHLEDLRSGKASVPFWFSRERAIKATEDAVAYYGRLISEGED